ncbi:MAG: bifunctional hydroxymethylpyrimidine kinase/phosphomethylpyrimidine kinase [Luteitalea sp.]|nr:bifunctional hydroxymethylpyrimidine kinase/phosphomethylpyrimidine kinase [Luteitalea sp.]
MKRALTIAGSDSGGGAGIQADLKTFAAHGVFGTSAITAITAQNTRGVTAVHPLAADLVIAQIEAVVEDIGVDAVKTGMLATAAIVSAVAAAADALELPRLVVDPVMVAKSGDSLLEAEAITALKLELLPRTYVLTPNAPEAAVLTDLPVTTVNEAREAARVLHRLGARVSVIKGGHLEGDEVVDLLFDGHQFVELGGPRLNTRHTHGTGCTFAAAIAANLALGRPLEEAVRAAKTYVAEAIRHAPGIGSGRGPIDHFWRLSDFA